MTLSKVSVTNMIKDAFADEECIQTIRSSVMESVESALTASYARISDLEDKVRNLDSANTSFEATITQLRCDLALTNIRLDQLVRKADDNDQYSRKLNIILDGLHISKNDDDNKIRRIVLKEIKRLDLDIDEYEVDRAHRTGSPYIDRNGKWHVPIVVRFTSWFARNTFYEARKTSIAYVKADITARRQDLLNDARKLLAVEESRPDKFFAFVFVDRNCHLSVKTKYGRFFKFNSLEEFHSLTNYVDETSPPDLSTWKILQAQKDKEIEPAIVNLHLVRHIGEWLKDEYHVYVGRTSGNIAGSPWGNPFKLDEHDIQTSLKLYEDHVTNDPDLATALGSLKKKSLGCWCQDPAQCHANVLLKLIGAYW